jgi:hypothetical protein
MKMRTMWRIRADMTNQGMTCQIRLGRFRISVITRWIGTHICPIEDGNLTRTQNSLNPSFS